MKRRLSTLTLILLLAPSFAWGEGVYWNTRDLLKDFFADSERVTFERVESKHDLAALARTLGRPLPRGRYVVFVGRTGSTIDGYALVDEEVGQHEPITFGLLFSPDGTVRRTEVMAYREGYGEEIREARFRRQYRGKGPDAPVKTGQDVVAISGATLSSKAMSRTVKRGLAIVELVRTRLEARENRHASDAQPNPDKTL